MQVYKRIFSSNKTINFIENKSQFFINNNNFLVKNPLRSDFEKIINDFNNSTDYKNLFILSDDIERCFDYFCSYFKIIEAAGGFVKNTENKFLFIFRHGKWDLPKGKLKKNENLIIAALRETEEETGVAGLEILNEMACTYHIYEEKNKNILKKTVWFEMFTSSNKTLKPQLDEDITIAKWLSYSEVIDAIMNSYDSIKEVVTQYIHDNKK